MSDHGDFDQEDDIESNVRSSRERRNSHEDRDSGSNSSHRCKFMIIKI